MTCFSTCLMAYPEPLSREQLEHYALANETLHGIPGLPDRFSPFDLSKWAKEAGLEVFYVDNCWIRVPVTADQLRAFYSAHLRPEDDARLAAKVVDVTNYLLEAEEF